jgi:hypothetical protein
MKNVYLTLVVMIALTGTFQAQEISKNALGLRLGDNDGFGGEITYQRKLSADNRLELDLGWRNSNNVDALKLVGLYQWVWNIDGGFNWYAGLGGGLGSWSYDDNFNNGNNNFNNNNDDSGAFALIAGDIGIEYNFDIPLLISLDFRPEFYFNSDAYRENSFGPDIALGIKFQF